ncbi:hypothetical protein BLA29_012597 [Euroglyphus maynei]|uniref:Uncharacterized protein n=1 Tax=Euroglyphus maynei TaxID=6958 RepID=A0A1Y3B1T8_EURMA|nr:hypothetical protein BLA29_012597 [Euroglyphus maynei]
MSTIERILTYWTVVFSDKKSVTINQQRIIISSYK